MAGDMFKTEEAVIPIPSASDRNEGQPGDDEPDADRVLASMGYKPVFKREFSLWSCFNFALSVSGLYPCIVTTFSYPLMAGGAASVVWSWLIAGAGALSLAFSVAEIASAYPTSGGLYFTLKYLAPPEWVPAVAWVDGWLNLIGQITGSASASYGAAQMLLAAVALGSGGSYAPTAGHTVGAMAALNVLHAMINSLSTAWLNHITKTYSFVHISVLVAACVALLALKKDKHSVKYVFTNTDSASGWNPPGFSFLFGFLSVAWTMTDYDSTAHIAEEAKDPARVVPKAIALALTFTYVAGWLFNMVLAFCMGDPASVLNSPLEQPVVQIFSDVLGRRGAVFFAAAAFVVMNQVCVTVMQAGSRTVFAFARDGLLPPGGRLDRIWPRSGTPVAAVWLYALLCVLVNLVGLGSYVTIAAVFNTCAIALDWSYCLPILCKLAFGRFKRGPWHLGAASALVNAWACAWTAFVSVIFLMPTERPVTSENMNYAVVILAAILVLSTGYWYIRGRHFYTGPRTQAEVEPSVIMDHGRRAPLTSRA